MSKSPTSLQKAPEEMTKAELIRALQNSRSSLWEARETIRKQASEIKRLKGLTASE